MCTCNPPLLRTLVLGLSVICVLASCGSSKPAKYRKKKDCDCPKWNHVDPKPGSSVHADSEPASWTPIHRG